jgi:hypothetical protein
MFEEFGLDNCKIELIENFPCNNREELHAREGFHIQHNDCINKVVPGRSRKEYREQNKEILSQVNKQYRKHNESIIKERERAYREKNKERIALNKKEYYKNNIEKKKEYDAQYQQINKDKILENKKQYYLNNKEELLQKRKIRIICECGCETSVGDKRIHMKSVKHKNLMEIKSNN